MFYAVKSITVQKQRCENRMLAVLLCVEMNCSAVSIQNKCDSSHQKVYVASNLFYQTPSVVFYCVEIRCPPLFKES